MPVVIIPAAGQGIPVNCGKDGSTVTNKGPATLYFRDELPVSAATADSSMNADTSTVLYGVQFFFVASGHAAVEVTPEPPSEDSGSTVAIDAETQRAIAAEAALVALIAQGRGVNIYSGGWPERPTGFASVEWIGPVDPDTDAENGDTWLDTA